MVRIIEHDGGEKVKPLDMVSELADKKRFRVAIFGSARIKPGDKVYKEVFNLAKMVGEAGYDVVTGGGPGLMEAANAGHAKGDKLGKAESIGLVIKLPWENKGNAYLEVAHTYKHFSTRLDNFLALSTVMVVTKGGIGSLLELSYMWQHMQVHMIEYKPIILIGKMWEDFIKWMKKATLPDNLVSPEDFDFIYIAKSNKEAMAMINEFSKLHQKEKVLRKIDCSGSNCVTPKLPTKNGKAVKVIPVNTDAKISKRK